MKHSPFFVAEIYNKSVGMLCCLCYYNIRTKEGKEQDMKKATFIKRIKSGYDWRGRKRGNDILVYSYRGHEYEIEDIPAYQQPAWYFRQQHNEEQRRIDNLIENKNKPNTKMTYTADEELEYFFDMLEQD